MANYDATINVRVSGTQAVDGVFRRVEQLESLVRSLNARPLNLANSRGWGQLADRFGVAQRELNNLKDSFINSEQSIEKFNATSGRTIAGARAIADSFKFIAANSDVATNQFREFTLASLQAGAAANTLGRQRLRVLNEELTGVNKADKTIGGRGVVATIIGSGQQVTNSIAALSAYRSELEDTLQLVEIGGTEFRALEEAIAGVEQRLSSARLAGQTSAITPAAGPASRIDTVASFEKRASFAKVVADQEYKLLTAGQQIVQAKLKETQQDELQNRLAQASEALARGELDVAKRLTNEIRNQRILYERANRAEQALMRPTSMTAGAAESVTGRRPGGLPPVPGSPAALRAAAQAPSAAPQVDNTIASQKRLNNLLASAQILEQKTIQLKNKGVDLSSQEAAIQNVITSIQQNGTNTTKEYLNALDIVLNSLRNELKLQKEILATQQQQNKVPKQPSATEEVVGKSKNNTSLLQNALIGGAFPLLFGGGVGAVAGGFAGGFIPGNPMMSIVTSAVGTIVDRVVAGARVAGESVRTLDTTISHMADKALFSSSSLESITTELESMGRYSLAAQNVQKELNRVLGVEGVKNLQNLGEASKNLNRAWAELNLQIQAAVAGPLAGLLNWLASVLDVINKGQAQSARLQEITKGLTPAQQKSFGYELQKNLETDPLSGLTPKKLAQEEEIFKKYEELSKKRKGIDIKLSQDQIRENLKNAQSLYVELAQLERDLYYKKIDYANDYSDMVLDMQRKQYDLDEELARRAQDIRIATFQKEIELLRQRGDIEIQIARNTAREKLLTAGPGEGLEASLRAALDEYRIGINEIQNDVANKERETKLNLIQLDIDNERFKLDTAKTVARTNYDNTVKIARINDQINRQNEEISLKNYQRRAQIISAELAILRGQALQSYAEAEAALQNPNLEVFASNFYKIMREGMLEVLTTTVPLQQRAQAGTLFNVPTGVPAMGALPKMGADFSSVDKSNKGLKEAVVNQLELLRTNGKLTAQDTKRLDLIQSINSIGIDNLNQITQNQQYQNQNQEQLNSLLINGMLPAQAQQLANVNAITERNKAALETEIFLLEQKKAQQGLTTTETSLLEVLINRYNGLKVAAAAAAVEIQKANSPQQRLLNAYADVRGRLTELADPVNLLVQSSTMLGDSFGRAFQEIINGSSSAQEALANMMRSIGENFVNMAAQIIAKQTTMMILGTILKALGIFSGAAAGGGGFSSNAAGFGGSVDAGIPALPNIPDYSGAFRANGGPVSAGSPYVVGEHGPELFVPGRNGSVVSNSGLRDAMGAASGSGSPVLNMSFQTTSIGGVEYVSRDQLEAAMAETRRQATRDGANRGMTMTLDRIKQSPQTRSRIGIR